MMSMQQEDEQLPAGLIWYGLRAILQPGAEERFDMAGYQ